MSTKKSNNDTFQTTNPLGFISYNTETFLQNKLNELLNNDCISFWSYIKHKGELNNEILKREKEHYHVRIVPKQSIKINSLKDEFKEFVNINTEPLGIYIGIENQNDSIFGFWYLYAIHDKKFLNSRGMKKEFIDYNPNDIITSNQQTLLYLISNIDYNTIYHDYNMKLYAKDGKRFSDLLDENLLQPSDYNIYNNLLKAYHNKSIDDEQMQILKENNDALFQTLTLYQKKFNDLKELFNQYKNSTNNQVKNTYNEQILHHIENFSLQIVHDDEFDEIFNNNEGGKQK